MIAKLLAKCSMIMASEMPKRPKGKGKKTDKASVKKSSQISQSDHTQAENTTNKMKEMETEKLRKVERRESNQKAGWWIRINPLAWFIGFLPLALAVLGWWTTGSPSLTKLIYVCAHVSVRIMRPYARA
jgi:hypothetical protein